jgi:hypothetical protein
VRTKRVPLTPEQAHAILPAVEGDRVEALHLIAAALGPRLGDGLRRRWQDLGVVKGTLGIRQGVQRVDGPHISK